MEKMRSKFQNARATKMVAGANVREKSRSRRYLGHLRRIWVLTVLSFCDFMAGVLARMIAIIAITMLAIWVSSPITHCVFGLVRLIRCSRCCSCRVRLFLLVYNIIPCFARVFYSGIVGRCVSCKEVGLWVVKGACFGRCWY